MKPRWETFEVSESTRFPELQGRRVDELAAERTCHPLDLMCELALAEDLTTRFRAYIANDDADAVGRLLNVNGVALGLSDAARTWTSSATRRCSRICWQPGSVTGR